MSSQFRPEVYAIDFGTTNSLLAAANATSTCPPIPLDDAASDPTILRSLLFFGQNQFSCGAVAIRDFVASGMQGRLIRSIKKFLPDRGFSGTQIGHRVVTIEDLIGRFLRIMRDHANRHFDAEVDRVVLGRPAMFSLDPVEDQLAQDRLERAAQSAGFSEVTFCPEPVAAAHDFELGLDRPMTVLVADFGGGTSDYTVVRMRPEGFAASDVLSLGGVSVAGDALDGSLMRHKIARHFGAEVTYQVPLGKNLLTMPRGIMEKLCSPADMAVLQHRDMLAFLRDVQAWSLGGDDQKRMDQLLCLVEDALAFQVFEAIEHSKCALSEATKTQFVFDYPTMNIHEWITRDEFEAGAERSVDAILRSLDRTLESAGLGFEAIDVVCCTGGTARVPRLARALEERFGAGKLRKLRSFHSVVQGLAERARRIARGLD
ncbi:MULTISPECIES: Hsp70 family protein [Polyangium]|uniref:Hsp70 family protein n=2 Tax=Polyangium TaxID=55 RepID=A0A4U1IAL8_9BACT|nr:MULTISPECIES: Hsp70 family protein [Polyangium]MDI1431446.1 Hsp70 family protein [Polyangium sorediatum]TKC90559.1 Hsp70 family protein [Polyangium fumosum]